MRAHPEDLGLCRSSPPVGERDRPNYAEVAQRAATETLQNLRSVTRPLPASPVRQGEGVSRTFKLPMEGEAAIAFFDMSAGFGGDVKRHWKALRDFIHDKAAVRQEEGLSAELMQRAKHFEQRHGPNTKTETLFRRAAVEIQRLEGEVVRLTRVMRAVVEAAGLGGVIDAIAEVAAAENMRDEVVIPIWPKSLRADAPALTVGAVRRLDEAISALALLPQPESKP